MPRPKDPIWNKFDVEVNPNSRIPWAQCRLCPWRHAGIPERMYTHYEKHHTNSSMENNDSPSSSLTKTGHQSSSHRRVTSNETKDDSRAEEVGLQEKVTQLEETLKKFRAEVDMKMTIVQQVLRTRNELFSVQKKLLDKEQALHETVLSQWKNISELAAGGIAFKFSDNGAVAEPEARDDLDSLIEDTQKSSLIGKRRALRATLARRERRKRQKMKHGSGDEHGSDEDGEDTEQNSRSGDYGNDNNIELEGQDEEDDDDEDSSSLAKGLEKKVFVQYYSEEEPRRGERVTRTPVWKYFLREENGGFALCKLCDEEGIQSVLKVPGCSTASLHAHLKFTHKMQVELNTNKQRQGLSLESRTSSTFPIKSRKLPSTKAEPEQEQESIVPDLADAEVEGNNL